MADQGRDGNEKSNENGKDERGEDPRQRKAVNIGLGAAYGAAGGVLVFAITRNPIWIAIGPAIGVVLAATFGSSKEGED